MFLRFFESFKLYSNEIFLVVGCEICHVLVSVGPFLAFCSYLDAFDLFLLLPLSLNDRLISLVGGKSKFVVLNYHVSGKKLFGRRPFACNNTIKVYKESGCLTQETFIFDLQVSQLDTFAILVVIPPIDAK